VGPSSVVRVVGGRVGVGVSSRATWGGARRGRAGPPAPLPRPPAVTAHMPPDQQVRDWEAWSTKLKQSEGQLNTKTSFTTILFLTASLMTCGMMILLGMQLPDFFTRTLLWLRSLTRYRLRVVGLNNLPSDGPVILATNCKGTDSCLQVLTATDRFTRFILVQHSSDEHLGWLLSRLTKKTHLADLKPGRVNQEPLKRTLASAVEVLERGEMVGLPADANGVGFDVDAFLHELRRLHPEAQVVPVYCGPTPPNPSANGARARSQPVYVVIGEPRGIDTTSQVIREEIRAMDR